MNQFDEQIYDDIKLEAQFQQQLMNEPLYYVDKYQIMTETLNFNNFKIQDENSRMILVKLIYLVNQGIHFSEQQVEELFFRITKLFQSNNSRLRQMIYLTLKIIMPYKYVHILIQCLSKDLISDNPQIKHQALKFIPFIKGEQYIQQIERFILNALIDSNLLISSTAMIVGIHIVNKFPNLVNKWLYEIIQFPDQLQENIEYHSLIFFHEIKKSNLSQFIKIVIQLMNKPLKPIIQQQLIKFIQYLFQIFDSKQKKIAINYLLQLRNNKDPLVFFQSAQTVMKIEEIQNFELQPLISHLNTILRLDNIQIYLQKIITLNLIEKFNKIPGRQYLLQGEILIYIKGYPFSFYTSLATKALQLCINLYGKSAAWDLRTQFNSIEIPNCQYSFLQGFLELIISDPTYGSIALGFIKLIVIQFYDNSFVNIVLKLLEQIMMNSNQNNQSVLVILSKMSQLYLDLDEQSQIIRLIGKFFLYIKIEQLDFKQITLIYHFLKNQLFNKVKDYLEFPQEYFDFICKEIINILQQNGQQRIEHAQLKGYNYMDQLKFDNKTRNQSQVSNSENRYVLRENQNYRQDVDFFH